MFRAFCPAGHSPPSQGPRCCSFERAVARFHTLVPLARAACGRRRRSVRLVARWLAWRVARWVASRLGLDRGYGWGGGWHRWGWGGGPRYGFAPVYHCWWGPWGRRCGV